MAMVDLNLTTCEKTEEKDMEYQLYKVVMAPNNKRIITVYGIGDLSTKRWFEEVLKGSKNKKRIVVGLSAAISKVNMSVRNPPFELLQISIGCNCLLFQLDVYYDHSCPGAPKYLRTFFEDPRVVAVGVDMAYLKNKLLEHHKIKIANAVEVKDDNVVNAVKNLRAANVDVFEERYSWQLRTERVIASTLDAYLCFSAGYDLISPKKKKKKGRD